MLNVYTSEVDGEIIGRVNENSNLDFCDGSNHNFRGNGKHGGLTKLRREIDGMKFVFIYTTNWQGDENKAWLITDTEALLLTLESGNDNLLTKYFPNEIIELEEDQ